MSVLFRLKAKLEQERAGKSKAHLIKGDLEKLLDYMTKKNVPLWLFGSSSTQLAAANGLHYALLYDTEQGTTYRIEECLRLIGITPMVSSREIRILIKLSRKSDLAFLWFLWEAHYKTPGQAYSLNEQLILSAISHLDMIPTMRALDHILPPPQPTKREIAQFKRRKEQKKKREQKHRRGTIEICKRTQAFIVDESFRKSPYFAVQKAPKLRPLTQFFKHPGKKVVFPFYDKYSDPHYNVPNENTRWFANYQLSSNKRIALGIIKEEIDHIFENTGEDIADDVLAEVVETELQKIMKGAFAHSAASPEKKYEKTERSLCLYHKCKEEDNRRRWLENRVREKQRCLDHFDMTTKRKEESRQRVLSRLYEAIEQLQVERKEQNASSTMEKNRVFREIESETKQDTWKCENNGNSYNNFGKVKNISVNDISISSSCEAENDCSSNEQFFKAAEEHLPYRFNFNKIFKFKDCDELNIRETFEQFLLENVSKPVSKKSTRIQPALDESVNKCAKQVWCDAIAKARDTAKIKGGTKFEDGAVKQTVISYNRKYYNPNNKKLMLRLLKDGLEYLKRDRRLVLPLLPEAYKLPVLFEFVSRRFGKVYTKKEMANSYKHAANLFKVLRKWVEIIPKPDMKNHISSTLRPYSHRHCYLRRFENYKKEYYAEVHKHIMQIVRIGWFASRAYLCSNGPPRANYFAYFPAHLGKIFHFRQWRSTDIRDLYSVWFKRQLEKSKN